MDHRYTKRPVTIEAFQLTYESAKDNRDWPEWLNRAWQMNTGSVGCFYTSDNLYYVNTKEGPQSVPIGNWLIRGVEGELYSCDPEIFKKTYDCGPGKKSYKILYVNGPADGREEEFPDLPSVCIRMIVPPTDIKDSFVETPSGITVKIGTEYSYIFWKQVGGCMVYKCEKHGMDAHHALRL